MIESAVPRHAEQPRHLTSSVEGPPAGATFPSVSYSPASGSRGCSKGSVDQRPSAPFPGSPTGRKRDALGREKVEARRSALVTTDALPKNFAAGGNRMLFFLDRLFHRRSGIVIPEKEGHTFQFAKISLKSFTNFRCQRKKPTYMYGHNFICRYMYFL